MYIINHAFGSYDSEITTLSRLRLMEVSAVGGIMILFGIQFYNDNQISFLSFIYGLFLVAITLYFYRKQICKELKEYKSSLNDFKKIKRNVLDNIIGSLIFSIIASVFFFYFPLSFLLVLSFIASCYVVALKLSDVFHYSE